MVLLPIQFDTVIAHETAGVVGADAGNHFHQAGDAGRTFSYALLAARQARRQLALESVVEHLDTARGVGGSLLPQAEYHIAIERGEALMLLREARRSFVANKLPYEEAIVCLNLGALLVDMGTWPEAMSGTWTPRER